MKPLKQTLRPTVPRRARLALVCLALIGTVLAAPVRGESEEVIPGENATRMTLADAVFLTLRTNRSVESAYIDRVLQKFSLRVAEDEFWPNFTSDLGASRSRTISKTDDPGAETRTTTDSLDGKLSIDEKIPTGGVFNFVWSTARSDNKSVADSVTTDPAKTYAMNKPSTWSLSFTQPLLKGGGIDVNTASLAKARLDEKGNVLSLKSTLMGTVDSVISAYRSFLQAMGQVEISKASLERAKKLIEINKILVDAGRMAELEMVQTRADVVDKEFAYETSLNTLDNARLNFLKVLDIEKHTLITPVDEGEIKPESPVLKDCVELALANRPDYHQSLLGLEKSKIDHMLAKNEQLWNLSLASSIGKTTTHNDPTTDTKGTQWNVGLTLNIPLWGDLTREQALLNAQAGLKKAKISLKELKDNIEIEVQDTVRLVKTALKQVRLARLRKQLSEQKLLVEQEKLKVGRTTNFQIVSFQNDLVSAQNSELSAITDYRNALTSLDKTLGTTLDTWKIEFKDYRKFEKDYFRAGK